MSRPDKVLSLLGIAKKAGRVVSGETATENAIKGEKAYLVIVAADASANTKKHFSDMCKFRGIPYVEYSDKQSLGRAIGTDYRSNIAVNDSGLAASIEEQIRNTVIERSGINEST